MTADVLRDYMLDRLDSSERRELQREIARDRDAANAFRRLRGRINLLRAKYGRVDEVPREWIDLLEGRGAPARSRRLSKAELARERTKTWL